MHHLIEFDFIICKCEIHIDKILDTARDTEISHMYVDSFYIWLYIKDTVWCSGDLLHEKPGNYFYVCKKSTKKYYQRFFKF